MAEIKWPKPTAYVVWQAMAEDQLSWSREPKALSNTPLYTEEQVRELLRNAGVPRLDPVPTAESFDGITGKPYDDDWAPNPNDDQGICAAAKETP